MIQKKKKNAKKHLTIQNFEFVICCARRLVEKNGVIVLIKAMQLLRDASIVCLIAGDGPQSIIIKNYLIDYKIDNVRLLGSLDAEELKRVYAASDLSVVPSITINGLQEATSITAIESMSCCIPTIASNIGGLKEIIVHNETGVLVEENNPVLLAESILALKVDKVFRKKLSEKARNYIVKNHSHIKATDKYIEVFDRAIHFKNDVK